MKLFKFLRIAYRLYRTPAEYQAQDYLLDLLESAPSTPEAVGDRALQYINVALAIMRIVTGEYSMERKTYVGGMVDKGNMEINKYAVSVDFSVASLRDEIQIHYRNRKEDEWKTKMKLIKTSMQ